MSIPGWSNDTSPRNLFTTNPLINRWSAASSRATVPNIDAKTPPRSMSPTTTTGAWACWASPMFT